MFSTCGKFDNKGWHTLTICRAYRSLVLLFYRAYSWQWCDSRHTCVLCTRRAIAGPWQNTLSFRTVFARTAYPIFLTGAMSSDLGREVQRHFSTVFATCDNPIGRALRFLYHRNCTIINEMQTDSDEFSDPDGELIEKPCKPK